MHLLPHDIRVRWIFLDWVSPFPFLKWQSFWIPAIHRPNRIIKMKGKTKKQNSSSIREALTSLPMAEKIRLEQLLKTAALLGLSKPQALKFVNLRLEGEGFTSF